MKFPAGVSPDDRRTIRAIEQQHVIETTESMGTPQGLRALFPTNHARVRMRKIKESDMAPTRNKPTQDEPQATGPLDRPHGEKDVVQRPAGDASDDTQRTDAPRQYQAAGIHAGGPRGPASATEDAPRTPVEKPLLPRQQEAEAREAASQDPGPPPERPVYMQPEGLWPAEVDVLNMAAEADDLDAAHQVNTLGLPPSVAQYKANIINWIETTRLHRAQPNLSQQQQEQQASGDEGDDQ